jgi:uncharacterized protein
MVGHGSRTTRRVAVLAAAAMTTALVPSVLVAAPAAAASPDLVISQVYGGGGNTGAPYTHDFVELFNRGTAPVSLAGMSVQYASASGTGNFGATSTQLTELPAVTLEAGQYYLVQQAAGAGNGVPLPTPDLVDQTPIAMAAGAGKVTLATGATSLGCNGGSAPCSPTQLARIVDLVGYGNANFFEGSAPAPTLSNTTAALRAGGGCTDTDQNGADFSSSAPAPRNTASPFNACEAGPPVINEFVANHVGADTHEFIEVRGAPNTDYSSYSVLQVEGDGAGTGVVDSVHAVGTTGSSGHWTTEFLSNALENGTLTLLLVENFAGAVGADLDTNNDGTLDLTPWSAVADTVAVSDGGAEDLTYADTVLAPGFGGSPFTPGGASRIPDGADTDSLSDWTVNDFDGAGLPDFTGTPQEGEALNTPGARNALVEIVVDECDFEFTPIHAIQGNGATFDPACGGVQTVEAVVTAVEEGLNGFYLQEEDADVDGDPETSEGIFVFGASTVSLVDVGDLVRATGTVAESSTGASSQTQLINATVEVVTAGVPLPAVTAVTFPVPSTTYLERFEGMRVELVDELVISEYFNYDRFGEVVLAKPLEGQDRLHTPTAVVDPGPLAQALAAEQALRIITLDDRNSAQNPGEIPHPGNGDPFSLDNRFRGGDTVTGVVGVIDHTFGLYRIQPTLYGEYEAVNPRPADAPEVGGSIQVASFNVLNYFLTIDRGGQDSFVCGANQAQECRGADTEEELERQRIKILAALAELDADVVGLMEMENTPGVEPAADLADGLNDILGAGTYGYVDTGVIGTDAIRLGFLYKPGTVRLAGKFAILDSSIDGRFVDTLNRPMLTQTFDEVATGARVTVSVNHLKSKGSACAGDPDIGDGQGNCNLTRTAAAEAIVDFLATDPTRSGDPDHLVIGDLNSYDHEDPIRALETAGYTDLVKEFGGEFAYSYVFDGKVGYLDHALSNPSLTPQVTGAAEWHINADEPDILDYDTTFKPPAIDALYEPNAFRSSDHDPVLVGLDLDPATPDRCYADGSQTVDSYDPGVRANGTAVPPGHRDATQALGMSDAGGDDPYWVTLGLEGEIVLEFARSVQNTNGTAADLRVVDAADGAKGRSDAAVVYASWDGDDWVELGLVTGTGEVDMGALPALRYVKVVDATPARGNPATDGYDLDAVEVLTGCV